jgi:hypothetical protein
MDKGLGRRPFGRGFVSSLIFVFGIIAPGFIFAQSWQTQEFLSEMQSRAGFYRFAFWVDGLRSVSRIRFGTDGTDRYHPFSNTMVLAEDLSDGGGRLKTWSQQGPMNLGTLAHESFHSFYSNHLSRSPQLRPAWDWMQRRSGALYRDLPKAKAKIALEEAYASLIGNLVTSRVTIARMLELRANDPERCASGIELGERFWKSSWNQEVKGYYSRDGIGEYWTDRMKERWAGVTGGDSDLPPDGTYFVDIPLNEVDRNWVSRQLFENRIQSAFEVTFKKELESLPCFKKEVDEVF